MRQRRWIRRPILPLLAALLLLALPLPAEPPEGDPPDPLAPFERLVGGEWHLDDSYQVFEWGVGRRSVRGRSYFLVDGEPRLVSEGAWYWHPGEQAIRGLFTAVEMPVELFDYTVRFQGETLIAELTAYAADGSASRYRERWTFTGEDRFDWRLAQITGDGEQPVMGGVYTRQ